MLCPVCARPISSSYILLSNGKRVHNNCVKTSTYTPSEFSAKVNTDCVDRGYSTEIAPRHNED